MKYFLAYYPEDIDGGLISMRNKHNPVADITGAHVTLVFPFEADDIGEINKHLEGILADWKKFKVSFTEFEKSWDNWLFLVPKNGTEKEELIRLHDELYTGPLAKELRTDLPYSPHFGIGQFNKESSSSNSEASSGDKLDEEGYTNALNEAKELGIRMDVEIDRISLMSINDDFTEIDLVQDFDL